MTTAIEHCRLVNEQGQLVSSRVVLQDGVILSINGNETADETMDAQGHVLLPGLIDCHVHAREPGLTHKEDFETAGNAAVHGGVTTILDMPNTNPPTIDQTTVDQKLELAKKSKAHVYVYAGATKENLHELKNLTNIVGVKVYAGSSTGNLLLNDYESIGQLLSEFPGVVAIHAEDEACIHEHATRFQTLHEPDIHSKVRDPKCAEEAVFRILEQLEKLKTPTAKLYFCHVTTQAELELIRNAKKKGLAILAEVTPQHLFLSQDAYVRHENFVKVNPPLRFKSDLEELWKGVLDGTVDTVATDHAPHTREEKSQDYWLAPSGVPGLETLLPLLLTAVSEGKLSWKRLIELTSENPAKIFPIGKKGKVAVGFDADLVLVDPDASWILAASDLKTKCGWSPFEGWKFKGKVVMTMVGGEVQYQPLTAND